MPALITTTSYQFSTGNSDGRGGGRRRLANNVDGTLWSLIGTAVSGPLQLSYSKDAGATWSALAAVVSGANQVYANSASMFIDQDDYLHLTWRDGGTTGLTAGNIYYMRGTPNAGRTAWTWSAAQSLTVFGGSLENHPDIVAHREGTGWVAHIVFSFKNGSSQNSTIYRSVSISSGGVFTINANVNFPATAMGSQDTFPTIDFNHTGDGVSIQGATPHLYVAWSSGTTGANNGILFRKATYAAGAWTWGAITALDTTRYLNFSNSWLSCIYDGTRVMVMCGNYGTNGDNVLFERDAADTTTTTRVLHATPSAANTMSQGAINYDPATGDLFIWSMDGSNGNGARYVNWRKWTRASATLGNPTIVSPVGTNFSTQIAAARGNRRDVIFSASGNQPYPVYYATTTDPPVPASVVITTSTLATTTGSGPGKRIDRTSLGVLWTIRTQSTTPFLALYYSTDNGATWNAGGTVQNAGSGEMAGLNPSIFIDQDDYLHVVFDSSGSVGGGVAGSLYYVRATPNAGHTAWTTWSAAQQISATNNRLYPDVVAHREGTGWVAHVVYSWANTGPGNSTIYRKVSITSGGVITLGAEVTIGPNVNVNQQGFASIDFHHTGDGKTVKGGTPHIFVMWVVGTTGVAYAGVRFIKGTYAAGAWTFGAERAIDTTRYHTGTGAVWATLFFDGTRVVICGVLSGATNDLMLYERDVADTTTTTNILLANVGASNFLQFYNGSAAYDAVGNVYFFGRDGNSSSGNGFRWLNLRKWKRSGAVLGNPVPIDGLAVDVSNVSTRRAISNGNRIDLIRTRKTASPYDVVYSGWSLTPTPPVLISPNGGEIINLGTTIQWVPGTDPEGGALTYDLEYSTNNGASWTPIVSGVSGASYVWDSSATPSSASSLVRVRAVNTSGLGSTWDQSNAVFTLQHNVAPLAATPVAPVGNAVVDRANVQRLSWTFNDPDAGDSQSQYDLQWRLGAGAWNPVSSVTPNQFWDAPAATFPAGSIEWQVRTYDSQGVVGPWSTSAFFTAASAPAAPVITYPVNNSTEPFTNDVVTWSAPSQAAYQVRKVADNAGAANTSVVYYDSGEVVSATARNAALAFPVNNRYEHIQVRIKVNTLWSTWTSVRVNVAYTPPPVPTLGTIPDDDSAFISVVIVNPAPGGSEPAVSYNDLYRRDAAEGGNGDRVAANLAANATWEDHTVASNVEYEYKAVAHAINATSTEGAWTA